MLSIVCSARLEAFSDHSGKLQLPLQEIIDWLSQKDEELSAQLPLQGDVALVQQEKETHAVGSNYGGRGTCLLVVKGLLLQYPDRRTLSLCLHT